MLGAGALILTVTLAWSAAALAGPRGGTSTAIISGSLSDGCRDFTAHSSKDISHVELHYADGGVVKDETIDRPDYSLDGTAGDEIDFAIVKSGTTSERFDCAQENSPPTALLEIETPPIDQTLEHCHDFFSGGLSCEQSAPRTEWTSATQIPNAGGSQSGLFQWGCGALGNPSLCSWTISFRGTSSSDPDNDIASWTIDFGEETSTSRSWSTDPPAKVAHDYPTGFVTCVDSGTFIACPVTLTVTDAAGQSDSDTIVMVHVDQTPD